MDDVKKRVKNKVTAIVLAVFLSFWSWLYTYYKNKHKFWIGLGVNLTLIVSDLTVIILLLSTIPSGSFTQQAITAGSRLADIRALIGPSGFISLVSLVIWVGALYLANLGIKIWAIIDNSIRQVSFYEDYPN